MGNKGDKSSKQGSQESFDIDDLNDSNIEKYFADAKKAGTLKNIERLDLSQKELNEIPPQIAKLPNLKILHLYDNNFKEIPSFIGTSSCIVSP